MASITFVDCLSGDHSYSGLKIVGLRQGESPFGCIYSFTPTVKAKSLSFSLSYTVVSNTRTVYCKVVSNPDDYDYPDFGDVTFTTGAAGSRTASFTITGTFNSGTPYYLCLQSNSSGNYGYMESISGTVTFTAAAPPIQYYDGNEWQPISALQYYNSSNQWADLTVAEYYNTNWVSTS